MILGYNSYIRLPSLCIIPLKRWPSPKYHCHQQMKYFKAAFFTHFCLSSQISTSERHRLVPNPDAGQDEFKFSPVSLLIVDNEFSFVIHII